MHIHDAEIIEETLAGPGDPGPSFSQWIAAGIDKLTSGNKANIVTSALIFADVVKNPDEMREIVKNYADPLNAYFETIDYEKLVENSDDKLLQPVKENFMDSVKENVPVLFAGVTLGVLGASIYRAKVKNKAK